MRYTCVALLIIITNLQISCINITGSSAKLYYSWCLTIKDKIRATNGPSTCFEWNQVCVSLQYCKFDFFKLFTWTVCFCTCRVSDNILNLHIHFVTCNENMFCSFQECSTLVTNVWCSCLYVAINNIGLFVSQYFYITSPGCFIYLFSLFATCKHLYLIVLLMT